MATILLQEFRAACNSNDTELFSLFNEKLRQSKDGRLEIEHHLFHHLKLVGYLKEFYRKSQWQFQLEVLRMLYNLRSRLPLKNKRLYECVIGAYFSERWLRKFVRSKWLYDNCTECTRMNRSNGFMTLHENILLIFKNQQICLVDVLTVRRGSINGEICTLDMSDTTYFKLKTTEVSKLREWLNSYQVAIVESLYEDNHINDMGHEDVFDILETQLKGMELQACLDEEMQL